MTEIMKEDIEYFKELLGRKNVMEDEPLKNHTTFKIGGPATCILLPGTIGQISEIVKYCNKKELRYFVLGNGSNLLIGDGGINGVVIKLCDNFSNISIDGVEIEAQAGILLKDLSRAIADISLTGFEFASGIPGTLGGAVYMNAGAYDGEMSNVVKSIKIVNNEGEIETLTNKEIEFGYRKSIIQEMNGIIAGAVIKLKRGEVEAINAEIEFLRVKRDEKQPLEMASAGSTFKRPAGHYAGKLIEDSGLRGYRYKDAMVSEKHCGFIVNAGDADFNDVMTVIKTVRDTVFNKFKVMLEPEIRIIDEPNMRNPNDN